jgi:glycosyltransferase involved in cell wall biosynthesis
MFPAIIAKKFYKKRVVLWILDIWPDSVYAYGFKKTKILSFFLDGFVSFIYNNSSALAISSQGFQEKITPYLKVKKEILYAPNWADKLDENNQQFSFSQEAKVHFTFAGNIGTVQNLDNIIKAFRDIDKNLSQRTQLNIIGDGSHLEELKLLVKKEKILNIVFWGRKPREEMQKYFQASDFLIVSLVDKPIFSLTVPAKLQTYIAAKRPIIAILEGAAGKIVEENLLGFSVKPNDLGAIKSVFEKSITLSEDERKTFMQNSQKLSETVFNKEKIIDKLLALTVGDRK